VHVFIPARGRLGLRFVEVKYRRHLSLARASRLAEGIARQTGATRERWLRWFFSNYAPPAERTLRATRLARVLRFYADKALRHHLDADTHSRFAEEIGRFLAAPSEYELSTATPDRGLVFCPDFTETNAERLAVEDDCEIWLFGPDTLPDRPLNAYGSGGGDSSPEPATAVGASVQTPPSVDSETAAVPPQSSSAASPSAEATASQGEAPVVLLGTSTAGEDIGWTPSLRGNPHLMIVGLPGMGKTTCLTNICRQLQRSEVTPIVFSYHDDIDEQLGADSAAVIRHDCRHLGFNPMRVTQPGPLAHIESAGQLRDIFQAVFPDLGELQLEQLRAAIKQSYEETGWGGTGEADTPPFHRFLEVLRERGSTDKRTQTLLARLNELDDFRFFAGEEGEASLLEGEQPRLVCIHAVSNDAVQRAYASFVLYRIYQDMFRRGRQERITHAVIFDEAHRASRLRLLPTMAKECRKYGLALIVASQEARDFDSGLLPP
jgi:DNA phosphorothioation-dependent restriction protein DptH